jgi:hypothetical protein
MVYLFLQGVEDWLELLDQLVLFAGLLFKVQHSFVHLLVLSGELGKVPLRLLLQQGKLILEIQGQFFLQGVQVLFKRRRFRLFRVLRSFSNFLLLMREIVLLVELRSFVKGSLAVSS